MKLFLTQEEERLRNAEECLEWYERERQRALAKIEELKKQVSRLEAEE